MIIPNSRKHPAVVVDLIGMDTSHEPGFFVDRPPRKDDWLLMCFRTRFSIVTAHGLEQGAPGDCILHAPGFPEWHGPAEGALEGFRNDWTHVHGDGVAALIERYEVPLNQRIPTGNSLFLYEDLQAIADEQLHRALYWEDAAAERVGRMLRGLGRAHAELSRAGEAGPGHDEQRDTFISARARILGAPHVLWTVASMAALTGLGPNRFAVLYNRFFHASPVNDLIHARLAQAQRLLLSSNATLENIAEQCGFSDAPYLSRVFRCHIGCTPGQYRRSGVRGRR
ncbi:MAG: AraC family transcriptional regulator [Capsulimonadaceae bacterium]|nr:AraC family transcriptional regulator [Capsulimonadaceae bacterium]